MKGLQKIKFYFKSMVAKYMLMGVGACFCKSMIEFLCQKKIETSYMSVEGYLARRFVFIY